MMPLLSGGCHPSDLVADKRKRLYGTFDKGSTIKQKVP
jgi:hypothetical protein